MADLNLPGLRVDAAGVIVSGTPGTVDVNGGVKVRGAAVFPGGAADVVESASVANLGTIAIADGSALGFAMIVSDQGGCALVFLQAAAHTVIVISVAGHTFGTALGAANNYNVYWDSGTARYRVENRVGGAAKFFIWRVGQFTGQ